MKVVSFLLTLHYAQRFDRIPRDKRSICILLYESFSLPWVSVAVRDSSTSTNQGSLKGLGNTIKNKFSTL